EVNVQHLAQEAVRDLGEDARAVAGVRLGADRASVIEVVQRGEGMGDDVVPGIAAEGGDEGHSARVVLVSTVVEALWRARVRCRAAGRRGEGLCCGVSGDRGR